MTRRSIFEYTEAIKPRYCKVTKGGKIKILDEFVQVTGLHRKAAIRLLNRKNSTGTGKRRWQRRRYALEVAEALQKLWAASDGLYPKRLKSFMPELAVAMRRQNEQLITVSSKEQLYQTSPSAIDRLLMPYRKIDNGDH